MGLLSRAEGRAALKTAESKNIASIKDEVLQFSRNYAIFNCILMEKPAYENGEKDFCNKVSEMVKFIGTVIPTSMDRPLILLPKAMDRELIAHRLSKNLNTGILLSFEADNTEKVISRLYSQL
jgi:hypothetical protein